MESKEMTMQEKIKMYKNRKNNNKKEVENLKTELNLETQKVLKESIEYYTNLEKEIKQKKEELQKYLDMYNEIDLIPVEEKKEELSKEELSKYIINNYVKPGKEIPDEYLNRDITKDSSWDNFLNYSDDKEEKLVIVGISGTNNRTIIPESLLKKIKQTKTTDGNKETIWVSKEDLENIDYQEFTSKEELSKYIIKNYVENNKKIPDNYYDRDITKDKKIEVNQTTSISEQEKAIEEKPLPKLVKEEKNTKDSDELVVVGIWETKNRTIIPKSLLNSIDKKKTTNGTKETIWVSKEDLKNIDYREFKADYELLHYILFNEKMQDKRPDNYYDRDITKNKKIEVNQTTSISEQDKAIEEKQEEKKPLPKLVRVEKDSDKLVVVGIWETKNRTIIPKSLLNSIKKMKTTMDSKETIWVYKKDLENINYQEFKSDDELMDYILSTGIRPNNYYDRDPKIDVKTEENKKVQITEEEKLDSMNKETIYQPSSDDFMNDFFEGKNVFEQPMKNEQQEQPSSLTNSQTNMDYLNQPSQYISSDNTQYNQTGKYVSYFDPNQQYNPFENPQNPFMNNQYMGPQPIEKKVKRKVPKDKANKHKKSIFKFINEKTVQIYTKINAKKTYNEYKKQHEKEDLDDYYAEPVRTR